MKPLLENTHANAKPLLEHTHTQVHVIGFILFHWTWSTAVILVNRSSRQTHIPSLDECDDEDGLQMLIYHEKHQLLIV